MALFWFHASGETAVWYLLAFTLFLTLSTPIVSLQTRVWVLKASGCKSQRWATDAIRQQRDACLCWYTRTALHEPETCYLMKARLSLLHSLAMLPSTYAHSDPWSTKPVIRVNLMKLRFIHIWMLNKLFPLMYGLDNIWKSGIWGCKKIEILRKSPLKWVLSHACY